MDEPNTSSSNQPTEQKVVPVRDHFDPGAVQKPSPCRIVLYTPIDGSHQFPAIIVSVSDKDQSVNLFVFSDPMFPSMDKSPTFVPYSDAPARGTWQWPKRT
jgi:hypothetical protein